MKRTSRRRADFPLLSPFEQWMVKSNLKTIRNGTPADQIIAQLRANGYPKIAEAVYRNLR